MPKHPFTFWHDFNPSLMQVMVKHSQDKDQFLKVAIKQMAETQSFEDELKGVNELKSVLLAWNQEHEDQLAAESQAKDGKHPWSSYFNNQFMFE
jgi:hypothetical protein